ncbi:tubulin-like doman-containing protein [Demequina rhizosphaerae]|uniref:tubulin-like doman-containing protein n=1 Tax=Demequina rhizosphaerae TaxID=1638985 RepID=UPI000780BF42|nr:tubulin-like doman-containing protein [Demequina rhizosphaerae]
MRKFLLVGCGGSGGATLSYMMDALNAEFALYGVDRIPAGIQFLHIDVPVEAEASAKGLPSVERMGGEYCSTGPGGGSDFRVVDRHASLAIQESRALHEMGTWAPRRPELVSVPLSEGAGQYRAVGRMVTLQNSRRVAQAIDRALERLQHTDADVQMAAAAAKAPAWGAFEADAEPIVLVVSSMAGGAGASMALDVCRILETRPGTSRGLTGVFLYSVDTFDSLPASSRTGVRANALAMLGEIIATQAGAADAHDQKMLRALGLPSEPTGLPPFARIFPVGRYVGLNRTLFGDGEMQTLYRGLGRGLAALALSGPKRLDQFTRYDLGNTGASGGSADGIGWGASGEDNFPWATFGSATIAMGRERYREYAAQRLARGAADMLVAVPGDESDAVDASARLDAVVEQFWTHSLARIGLPGWAPGSANVQSSAAWFGENMLPLATATRMARAIVERDAVPVLSPADGNAVQQWFATLRRQLPRAGTAMGNSVRKESTSWAYDWHAAFAERLEDLVESAVVEHGIPYAARLIKRLGSYVADTVAPAFDDLAAAGPTSLVSIPDTFAERIQSLHGRIDGNAIDKELHEGLTVNTRNGLMTQTAGLTASILRDAIARLIEPIETALRNGLGDLEVSRSSRMVHAGLAEVKTDLYGAWPSEGDQQVPDRFAMATNEVLLTKPEHFGGQFTKDVLASAEDRPDYAGSLKDAIAHVVSGEWESVGAAPAPGGLLTRDRNWICSAFPINPRTEEPQQGQRAAYRLAVTPKSLVERARAFVLRGGAPFDVFCRVSLREYFLQGPDQGVSPAEVEARRELLAESVKVALRMALPQASVSERAVQEVHRAAVAFRYGFSPVPFQDMPAVASVVQEALNGIGNVQTGKGNSLESFLSADENATHIDIFGGYANYSPLVFDAILDPIGQEWHGLQSRGRADFWKWRRARPLAAAMPMSRPERLAMIAGWYVELMIGGLALPATSSDPVRIYDTRRREWLEFPHPLLTAAGSTYTEKSSFEPEDYLPAVLESRLLALADFHQGQAFASIRPYTALREAYDAMETPTASDRVPESAEANLVAWLRSGEPVAGGVSRVMGSDDPGLSVDERRDLAIQWLRGARDYIVHAYGDGRAVAPSRIQTRDEASEMNLFADIAGDVVTQIDALERMVAKVEVTSDTSRVGSAKGAF